MRRQSQLQLIMILSNIRRRLWISFFRMKVRFLAAIPKLKSRFRGFQGTPDTPMRIRDILYQFCPASTTQVRSAMAMVRSSDFI